MLVYSSRLKRRVLLPETTSCWLCLAAGPPYYEGTAVTGSINATTDPSHCPWVPQNKLTLTEVSGTGSCTGHVLLTHQHLCNNTLDVNTTGSNQYLLPNDNNWWACSTGLTPCVSTTIFNQSKDFCVMIRLVPRIYYHPEEAVIEAYESKHQCKKGEPVSLTLAVMLGRGLVAGIGTGATALVK